MAGAWEQAREKKLQEQKQLEEEQKNNSSLEAAGEAGSKSSGRSISLIQHELRAEKNETKVERLIEKWEQLNETYREFLKVQISFFSNSEFFLVMSVKKTS